MAWDTLIKKTFRKKEEILPMQLAEVDSLKTDLEAFFLCFPAVPPAPTFAASLPSRSICFEKNAYSDPDVRAL